MKLFAYQPGKDSLTSVATFKSYRDAVLYGQQHFGYGKFLVDTGSSVPSREEQLLIEPNETRYAIRMRLLESL